MSEIHHGPNGARGSILDAAIDRAVRQMVQRDPAPGLRARVQARITAAGVRSAPPVLRYFAVAAAVALLVLAVGLRRDRAPEPQNGLRDVRLASEAPGATAAHEDPRQSAPRQAEAGREQTRSETVARRSRRAHTDVIPMPTIQNVFGQAADTVASATVSTREEAGAAAVVEITPAAADTIAVPALSVPPLHVEPLTIAPIRH